MNSAINTDRPAFGVCGQPEFKAAATSEEIAEVAQDSGCPPEPDPASAGWDISWGCRINYGREPDGPLVINIQLGPDYDGSGVIRRAVTPEQLVRHAQHLLSVAGADLGAIGARSTIKAEGAIDAAIRCCRLAAEHLGMSGESEVAP